MCIHMCTDVYGHIRAQTRSDRPVQMCALHTGKMDGHRHVLQRLANGEADGATTVHADDSDAGRTGGSDGAANVQIISEEGKSRARKERSGSASWKEWAGRSDGSQDYSFGDITRGLVRGKAVKWCAKCGAGTSKATRESCKQCGCTSFGLKEGDSAAAV